MKQVKGANAPAEQQKGAALKSGPGAQLSVRLRGIGRSLFGKSAFPGLLVKWGQPFSIRRLEFATRDQIDWETDPERLRRGDLSCLAHDLASQIERAAKSDEIKALAAELNIPGSVVVLALLAKATPKNRAAQRFARTVLKDITAIRIAETLTALDLA